MVNLEYSPKALNALSHFHRVRYVVYVEGPEDLRFWTTVLTDLSLPSFKVKITGGQETLRRYAESIVQDNTNIVTASDLDFADLDGSRLNHPRVIYTYGYSIENSLCNARNLALAVSNLACTEDDFENDVELWLQHVAKVIEPLVVLDIAARSSHSGSRVPLHAAPRLLDDKKKHLISQVKVRKEVAAITRHIPTHEREKAQRLLSSSAKGVVWHLRGHFLISAALSFVRSKVERACKKRITLSHEAMFAILLGQFRTTLADMPDQGHLQSSVSRLIAA